MIDDIKPPKSGTLKNQHREPPSQSVAENLRHLGKTPGYGTLEKNSQSRKRFQRLRDWLNKHSKKEKVFLLFLVFLVLGGLASAYFYRLEAQRQLPILPNIAQKPPEPEPTTTASRLTGVEVPIELDKRPVTGIILENSPSARPQSGLREAGVVFEAVAEGGITRYLALYQEARPDNIGPIRSARPYFLDWLMPFDAPLAHVGGSPQALSEMQSLGIPTIGQFDGPEFFERVTYRYAPHNMYSNMAKLDEFKKRKNITSSDFEGFERKEEKPAAEPSARVINLGISGPLYDVRYEYNAETNKYKRTLGGRPHTDEKSGQQLTTDVVVALVIPRSTMANGIHTEYKTVGSGEMFVFQDGRLTKGTWSKESRRAQFEFKKADGSILKLNPGQTWVTMVNDSQSVSASP